MPVDWDRLPYCPDCGCPRGAHQPDGCRECAELERECMGPKDGRYVHPT